MNLSAEEKIMYEVMMAIYESGIPMSFKGSMVLKACLLEAGYSDEIRHTVDIDGNWYSDTSPSEEQMRESLQSAIEKAGIELRINSYRAYGEGKSAGFELADKNSGEILFSMDIDVNRPTIATKIYEIQGLRFLGATTSQMLADKIEVISKEKVFRRIKDIVDLYYLSKICILNKGEVEKVLSENKRTLGDFHDFLNRTDELRHSYNKFRFAGDIEKPAFDIVYQEVKTFIRVFC